MTYREKLIALVDNDCLRISDAIILLEGDGLNRCSKAIELYNLGYAKTIVFSGGITNLAYGSVPFSEVHPILINSGIPDSSIIHENRSQNTREQALGVIKLAITNQWQSLILVASHYHQYRAYLTFLREVLDSNNSLLLYNAPEKKLDWFTETGWGKRFDLLESEFDRMDKYETNNHLASFEEAIEYQKWKEQQR
ncbi:MAG: YdcF family protein [Bacteroidetes bacterium]|nr:YdcF family protein [Bacteroidota bacterium]